MCEDDKAGESRVCMGSVCTASSPHFQHGARGGGRGGVFRHCYELSEPELQLLAVRIVTATG